MYFCCLASNYNNKEFDYQGFNPEFVYQLNELKMYLCDIKSQRLNMFLHSIRKNTRYIAVVTKDVVNNELIITYI